MVRKQHIDLAKETLDLVGRHGVREHGGLCFERYAIRDGDRIEVVDVRLFAGNYLHSDLIAL